MADLSQLELNGTTYDLKDATARGSIPSPATAAPSKNISGNVGTSTNYARADHSHSPVYGTCSTAAATAEKAVVCSGFSNPADGAVIYITFTYACTSSSAPTLNVNSTGAKNIYSPDGMQISPSNYNGRAWEDSETVGFVYRSNAWYMLTPPLSNQGIFNSNIPSRFTRGYLNTILKTDMEANIRDGMIVTLPNVSDSNRFFRVPGITTSHTLIQNGYAYISNPSAVGSDLTLTTAAGQTIIVSGTLTGTTDIQATFVAGLVSVTGTAQT